MVSPGGPTHSTLPALWVWLLPSAHSMDLALQRLLSWNASLVKTKFYLFPMVMAMEQFLGDSGQAELQPPLSQLMAPKLQSQPISLQLLVLHSWNTEWQSPGPQPAPPWALRWNKEHSFPENGNITSTASPLSQTASPMFFLDPPLPIPQILSQYPLWRYVFSFCKQERGSDHSTFWKSQPSWKAGLGYSS